MNDFSFTDFDFDLSKNNQKSKKEKREYLAKIKYEKVICKKASSFKDIVGGDLKEGIQYRLVTNMSFNAITVIQYLIEFYDIEEMYIVVFRMNNKSFDYLKSIIEKDKIKAGFLVSVFFANNKKYERWSAELNKMDKEKKNVRVSFSNTHAKVFLVKTKCNKNIVFEGSGNLSHNEALEQYIIEDNKIAYNFHKNWIEEILNN